MGASDAVSRIEAGADAYARRLFSHVEVEKSGHFALTTKLSGAGLKEANEQHLTIESQSRIAGEGGKRGGFDAHAEVSGRGHHSRI
jgi:hypothetical protein